MNRALRSLYEYCALCLGWALLGTLCLSWIPFALALYPILPRQRSGAVGRYAIMTGFKVYVRFLALIGACRFDLGALDALRGRAPVIIAPNHPCLLDAVLVISRLPNVVCIMKAALIGNVFLGAGARLARYIRNDSTKDMVIGAVNSLHEGNHLLIFPEGTRTRRAPVNPFLASIGFIARRAGVPVQTVFIETDSDYLSKGWPVLRKPSLPITYRIRLGRSFEPEDNVKLFMARLERYFMEEMGARSAVAEPPPAARSVV